MVISSIFLCFLIICTYQLISASNSFDIAQLVITGNETNTPFDFTVKFRTTRDIYHHEVIAIRLPRFTRSLKDFNISGNISFGSLVISPSYYFHAAWIEGVSVVDGEQLPYLTSELHLQTKGNYTLVSRSNVELTVYKENGIGVQCGFPSSDIYNATGKMIYPFKPFLIATINLNLVREFNLTESYLDYTYSDATASATIVSTQTLIKNVTIYFNNSLLNNDTHNFDYYTGIGKGCKDLNRCSFNGACDFCFETCRCYSGFGNETDILQTGGGVLPDCSTRTCPSGRAIGDIPTSSTKAHIALAECSNVGVCDRSSGKCKCSNPWSGTACDKLGCPNQCSGNGRCVTMQEISRMALLANPKHYVGIEYGSGAGVDGVAWDFNSMQGCVCDSSWEVGFLRGQRQLAEYFGPDCSLKHCPSGDDPFTSVNEEDCRDKNQSGIGPELGQVGNLCHVDCSNRGICDYNTGRCSCFEDSWGEACENIANAGRHHLYGGADADSFETATVNNSIIIEGN